jgi:hypothetical protein
LEQVFSVCVGAEAIEQKDASLDFMHFAENPDWRNSFKQLPSQSAFRLKANEYDCVVGITDAVIKVMLNSPSSAHAASGDDYAWLAKS